MKFKRSRQKLPQPEDESQALVALKELTKAFLVEHAVTDVAILAAVRGRFRFSPIRIKLEAVIQIAATELGLKVHLISAVSLRAREKKFGAQTGSEPDTLLNDGEKFTPNDLRDATLVAWAALDE